MNVGPTNIKKSTNECLFPIVNRRCHRELSEEGEKTDGGGEARGGAGGGDGGADRSGMETLEEDEATRQLRAPPIAR
jgi:hypothetical protein